MAKCYRDIQTEIKKIIEEALIYEDIDRHRHEVTIQISPKPGGAEFGREYELAIQPLFEYITDASVDVGPQKYSFIDKIGVGKKTGHLDKLYQLLTSIGTTAVFNSQYCNFETVIEKINLDFYRIFSQAAKTCLVLASENEVRQMVEFYLKIDDVTLYEEVFIGLFSKLKRAKLSGLEGDNYLILRSLKITGYQDLGPSIVDYIQQHGRPPESISTTGGEIPLSGL